MRNIIVSLFLVSMIAAGVAIYLTFPLDSEMDKNVQITESTSVETDPRLQRDADALLYLFDNMPSVPVLVSDAPIIKTGTNTERGVAYTNCNDLQVPSIIVKKEFYVTVNEIQRTNILKHELTHAWLCRQRRMNGHDDDFRKKFESVGGFGN